MHVYEVKIIITTQAAREYYRWLKPHAQELVATNCFSKFEIIQEQAGSKKIYRCQYFYNSPEDFEKYVTEFAPKLRRSVPEKFIGHFEIVRTNYTQAQESPV